MKHAILWLPLLMLLPSSPGFSADDSKNCKIIERDGPPPSGGSISTSVHAGNGAVSAQTTGTNGTTVRAGDGRVASSVTTGSGRQSQTVLSNSDGSCTVYRYREKKNDE